MNQPARRRSSYRRVLEEQQQPSISADASSSSANNTTYPTSNNINVMDGAHRKIELQSPEDLTFLINNVRRAATEHVTAAFPPVDSQDGAEEDELRVRIEKLVDDYICQTFTLAAPSLSINGFDLDPKTFPAVYLSHDDSSGSASLSPETRRRRQNDEPEVQYEAFDARKRARVEELAREEEDLMREIAALKRRVPSAAAAAYADGFGGGVRADEEALEGARARATSGLVAPREEEEEEQQEDNGAGEGRKKKRTLLGANTGPLERQADVERDYEGLVETLSRLKREMPATVAKMERARVAGQYVVTER